MTYKLSETQPAPMVRKTVTPKYVTRARKKAERNHLLSQKLMAQYTKTIFQGHIPDSFDPRRISMNDLFPLICDGRKSYRNGKCDPSWLERSVI